MKINNNNNSNNCNDNNNNNNNNNNNDNNNTMTFMYANIHKKLYVHYTKRNQGKAKVKRYVFTFDLTS